ncbi:hypothetical protein SAMN05216577_1286 [Pseudomonas citronellolis]|uniref:Uncharacterized protein n=1 Tax=Pseudomonas citronellolis TaxID=53408 RepID=A0AAQ1KJ50_9PSED|nr:hypothetical protein [Pseudomonas citronellolis]TGC32400.1 hypothetical protein CW310_01895 [Pseudomonas citronellolis]SFD51655.1 hypothetical protein SAMN05216577_1286 [Pseudomonas citronellolis]
MGDSFYFEVREETDVEKLFDGNEYVRPRYRYDVSSNRIVVQLDPGRMARVTARKDGKVLVFIVRLGSALAKDCAAPHGVYLETAA